MSKLLVSGHPAGKFSQLISRAETVGKSHGPFDLLLCLGSPYSGADPKSIEYLEGKKKVPLPTYILTGDERLPEDILEEISQSHGQVQPNLTFLGRTGIMKTTQGLSIAYLGGVFSSDRFYSEEAPEHELIEPFYLKSDLDHLIKKSKEEGFRGVDILLTFEWPRDVTKFAPPTDLKQMHAIGSSSIGELVAHLRPRYHFASKEITYYERPPFQNHEILPGRKVHVTRFFGMAPVANTEKKKWIYAVNVTPLDKMDFDGLNQLPADATEFPFGYVQGFRTDKRDRSGDDSGRNYFFDPSGAKQQGRNQNQGNKRQRTEQGSQNDRTIQEPSGPKRFQPNTQGCWFCLANPQAEKHLVVSIGTEAYIAIAKGGLTSDNILIVPMEHHPSSLSLASDAIEEIGRYKLALKKAFKESGKDLVIYEVNSKTQHTILQCVPVPEGLTAKLKDSFIDIARENGVLLQNEAEVELTQQNSFFKVELPSGINLVHVIQGRFPMTLGRQILAKVLGTPEKADWKFCVVDKEKEAELAARFRNFFKPYDFTLE